MDSQALLGRRLDMPVGDHPGLLREPQQQRQVAKAIDSPGVPAGMFLDGEERLGGEESSFGPGGVQPVKDIIGRLVGIPGGPIRTGPTPDRPGRAGG